MTDIIRVYYFGGPTMLMEIEGLRFMSDPTLDNAGNKYQMTPAIELEKTQDPYFKDFGAIDYVLLTHDTHQDNLDTKGRELLTKVKKVYTTKDAEANIKDNTIGMVPWQSETIIAPNKSEITITATPARHGPAGSEILTGNVIGFVVTVKKQGKRYETYLTGDTVYYEGVKEVSERFDPQYVFAFAGSVKAMGLIYITMNENDLVDCAHAFKDATIIPVHYEGWAHYSGTIEPAQKTFEILGITNRLKILEKDKVNLLKVM